MHHFLAALLSHPHGDDPLVAWRRRTMLLLVRIYLVIGLPIIALDSLNQWYLERWPLLIWNLLATLVVCVVALAPRIDHRVRSLVFIGGFLGSGLLALRTIGLFGFTTSFMVLCVLLAVLFLSPRAALLVWATCVGGISVVLGGFAWGWWAYPFTPLTYADQPRFLWSNGLLMVATATAVALIVGSLVYSLRTSLQATQTVLAELRHAYKVLADEGSDAKRQLRQREALLSSINDALPAGYIYQVLQRRDGSVIGHTYVSGGVEPLLGLNPAQIQADSSLLHNTILPQDRFTAFAENQRALTELRALELEHRRYKADGSVGWFYLHSLPQPLPDGVVRWNGICLEITPRKEAELALAEQLRYAEALAACSHILLLAGAEAPAWEPIVQQALATLRRAVDCARLGLRIYPSIDQVIATQEVVVFDQDPCIPPFVNHFSTRGRDDVPIAIVQAILAGEAIMGSPQELFLSGSPQRTHYELNHVRTLFAIGVLIGGKWRGHLVASEQQERTWNEPTERLLRTAAEMISAFIQQWELASLIRAREAQVRALGDNLPNGFVYQLRRDAEWRPTFTYLSSGVEPILGITPEEGLRNAEALYAKLVPADRERVETSEQQAMTQLQDVAEVVGYLGAQGERRWIYLCDRPRTLSDGSIIWDGLAIDITERQLAAEELTQARDAAEAAARVRATFLATMSHEIRTPLNAVIGMASLLQDTALSADQRSLADTISTGGQALLALINDILDFSRMESGHVAIDRSPFDLHGCLAGAVDLVGHGARQKGLKIGYSFDPELPRKVCGDETRLRQILLNLLGNAIKFTSAGEVQLHASVETTAPDGPLVRISVNDTGIGMTLAQQERIFEAFVQAETNTARRYGGTGLGLAISRQLATLMGGTLTVSSAPGHGSTFTLRLPLPVEAGGEAAPSAATNSAETMQPLDILVAEDNLVNQELMRRLLGRMGHQVTIVSDGKDAVTAVCQMTYDVLLIDLQMPELDGASATRQIRALGQAIHQPRIIAITASVQAADREEVLDAGMDGFLTKPVQRAELVRVLSAVAASSNP
ncbi:MAG: response regulator [Candidatus Viridilinea halotolerans]|uniref:histidine kinase n=1 Tax=Candidatus Viridilinea halotolerans TaxID=2491704 RepID=A0A426TWL8_9CHLR|nr:MAG: response regulator [Candidatus Viridilinea halotolerans]